MKRRSTASQPEPDHSTPAAVRAPPAAASVGAPVYRATLQRCVALLDWWLVRDDDGEIRVSGYCEKNKAARVFTSGLITTRHADGTLVTADQKIVLIRGPLNISQMYLNGFPYEVIKYFRLGFPFQWEKYANPNMEHTNEHTQSPAKSIESMEYNLTEFDFRTSKGSTGNTNGHGLSDYGKQRIQEPSGNSGDYENSMGTMKASEGLCNGRMGTPDESFENPGPGAQATRADDSHEDPQTDASEQMMFTHSVDSALLVNNDTDKIEKERGASKSGKSRVCPRTKHAVEVLNKGVSLEHGSVDPPRRLRSGKVYGMSNGASLKKGSSKGKTISGQESVFKRRVSTRKR